MKTSLVPTARMSTPAPRQALMIAGAGVAVWAALTQQPVFLLTAAVAVAAAILLARTAEGSALALALVLGTVAADAAGRVATVAGVRLTIYQVVVAVIVAMLAWGVARRRIRVLSSALDIPAILFLTIAASTVIGAQDQRAGLVALVSLASSVLLAFVVYYLVDSPGKAQVVIWSALGIASVLAVFALLERAGIYAVQPDTIALWTTGIRARVTFKDPNILATFLMASALLAAPLTLTLGSWKSKVVALIALAVTTAGLVVTFSRGAFLGLALGAVAVLVLLPVKKRFKIAIVATVVFAAVVLTPLALGNRFVQTKLLAAGEDTSVTTRVVMNEGAIRMFSDRPTGVGVGNYAATYRSYSSDAVRGGLVESHNAYLTILVETGVFGFAAFLWLLWRFVHSTVGALRANDRRVVTLAVGALASGVAIAAQAMTYSLESNKLFWLTIGLGMAAARMARPDPIEETP